MERPEYIMFFREVFEHPDCSKVDAEVYGYVYWFTKLRNEKCTASNETLAQLVGTTPQTISNSLTTLEKAGFIKRVFKDASKSERLEIVALLHVTRRGSPTDVPRVHLQVKGGTPTGEQSESIKREHKYTANAVSTSLPDGFTIEVEGTKQPRTSDSSLKKYNELCDWLSSLTGAPMPTRTKQYRHLKDAKAANITIPQIKERAEELWAQKFYQENGMDWGAVVNSFNRKG